MTLQDVSNVLSNGLLSGLPYILTNLGIYLIFRILNDFDLTVEASYVLGAGVCAVAVTHGVNPWVATIAGACAGGLAGLVTSMLHVVLKISVLLAGIIMSIGLYSINLRVMGKPNVGLLGKDTIVSWLPSTWSTIGMFAVFGLIASGLLWAFMRTDVGLAIRGFGGNSEMVRGMGVSPKAVWIISLVLCNALVGLSGAVQAQNLGFADVNMGLGTIVAALGSILLGEALIGKGKGILLGIVAVIIGTIVFRITLSLAFRLGISPTDLKLFTAIILVFGLTVPLLSAKLPRLTRRTSYRDSVVDRAKSGANV